MKKIAFENQYIDHRFGVYNYNKYEVDLKEKKFSKLCLTEIVNAGMLTAYVGHDAYNQSIKDVLKIVVTMLKESQINHQVFVYSLSFKSFIVATNDEISDDEFMDIMKGFYHRFERSTSSKTQISGISKFILVFKQENMLDHALATAFYHKESIENFLVSRNEKQLIEMKLKQDYETYTLLNYAIEHDAITPYFQGIYDNHENKITKYEALIRLIDADGKVIFPYVFLDVAKKFNLYNTISNIMIDKTLKLFENSHCEVNINISSYDVDSVECRNSLLARIKDFKEPHRITIEFVETENYQNLDDLMNFLIEVKSLGCKIAIDDFGVGFATYISVIALRPDIIKIDGEIIKHLATKQENRIILDSICYMAKLINATIVAEYVENEEIQSILIQYQVDYSQGYLFAKPEPFEKLNCK